MKQLNLNTIGQWSSGIVDGNGAVDGINVDTRFVKEGDLFVCLRGERVDGHTFAQTAIDNGATALLVDHKLETLDVPQIIVEDTLVALQKIAKGYRNTLSAYFIGITGSNGKTSTKDILFSILAPLGKTIATYKNQNTEIGTYLNLFRMDEDTQYGIFEMGLDFPNDVAVMTEIVRPHAAMVTSLAPTHIVNFEDIHHIAREKFVIFNHVQNKDMAFYQGDFQEYRQLDQGFHTFGYNADNEYIVDNVNADSTGISFTVNQEAYTCNLLGGHQASNCAGVIAMLSKIGISKEAIQYGLNNVALTSLRTELVNHAASLVLLDAYKSNPISAIYALELLNNYAYSGDRIAVLSDMVELGDDSIKYHEEVLEYINTLNLQHVFLLGPDFKSALTNVPLNTPYTTFETFETLYNAVAPQFDKEQMILIKGSRFYALERLMKEA
ncbi:UDP-N-acetylmuramoyl-tripeptide--D-alanyl-D-alanine ligase [Erysipelothrix aquatica]|uniref:UDP-N-acetylmuramoyl-tripeptide--D-alanyl-D- alanine ligase n=1 Tax=Erysipelothrix aquatica TaxID=2683714 RepID=UPI001359B916|nr:UDP-N-acetylmuramoyl-tripeptide--D-alanyl-D-alanine ligase [Erysipelothrix aquatica]